MKTRFLEKEVEIVKNGKKLPDRISYATFIRRPFLKQMKIEKEGNSGYAIVHLKDYMKELKRKGNRNPSFEEILDLYLKNKDYILTNRKYDSSRLSPKISGTLCERSNTIIWSTEIKSNAF